MNFFERWQAENIEQAIKHVNWHRLGEGIDDFVAKHPEFLYNILGLMQGVLDPLALLNNQGLLSGSEGKFFNYSSGLFNYLYIANKGFNPMDFVPGAEESLSCWEPDDRIPFSDNKFLSYNHHPGVDFYGGDMLATPLYLNVIDIPPRADSGRLIYSIGIDWFESISTGFNRVSESDIEDIEKTIPYPE